MTKQKKMLHLTPQKTISEFFSKTAKHKILNYFS